MSEARPESELKAIFTQDFSRFEGCGKSMAHYFIATAGRFSHYGTFDHGVEVYQWVAGRFIAEVWFNDDGFDAVSLESAVRATRRQSNDHDNNA